MRTQTEIEDRIRLLLKEELERCIAEAAEKLPHLCAHNHRQPLDTRKQVEGESNEGFNRITDRHGLPVLQTMGLCMMGAEHPEDWQGTICDEPIDAQRCPYFEVKRRAEVVEAELRQQMRDIDWVRKALPEVHALLWTLDASALPAPPPEPEPTPEVVEPQPLVRVVPRPSWWQLLWFRIWAWGRR